MLLDVVDEYFIHLIDRYEYPGIHKVILNTFRAAQFYANQAGHDISYVTPICRPINSDQR